MQTSFLDYYRELLDSARGEILKETEETILGTKVDELAGYICQRYYIEPIKIDENREISWDPRDYLQDIPANQREGFHQGSRDFRNFQCQQVIVEVPICPNRKIEKIAMLRASTHSLSYSDSDFRWSENMISYSFETKGYGFEHNTDKIKTEVEGSLSKIQETISCKNSDIVGQNAYLLQEVKNIISDRKQKISQNKEKIAKITKSIKIPLKKKVGIGVQPIHIEYKKLVQKVKPKPNLPEEYILDSTSVMDVINLLDNQAKNYENTPKVTEKLGEEDLRDLLLANLNSIFEGGATGETFSKKGKSDIYLKISKGNIFVFECKIWGGKKLYANTIDQLRGYLTWRHNYGVLITFVRNKELSKVLKESQSAIQEHTTYRNGFRVVNDTHFISNHIVDDEDKEVEIHHLFYHLYTE